MTTNETYMSVLRKFTTICSGPCPRGQLTREFLSTMVRVDMEYPVITIPERKLNYRHMVNEALWILSGRNDLQMITRHCKRMADFTDDGRTLSGAYGVPFAEQVRYVVDALVADHYTRQAVMTLWRQNPRPSRDIPCTVAMQFMLRDAKLHTNVFMRSSDVWLGLPYDIFCFSMMTSLIALLLHEAKKPMPLRLGTLSIFAGSLHMYHRDTDKVIGLLTNGSYGDNLAMQLYEVISPDHLYECLNYALDGPGINSKHPPIFQQLRDLCR